MSSEVSAYTIWSCHDDHKMKLVNFLLQCQNYTNLSSGFPWDSQIAFANTPKKNVENIVNTCLKYHGGIEWLVDRLFFDEEDSQPMSDVFNVLDQIFKLPVSWEKVTKLKSLLNQVSGMPKPEELLEICRKCLPSETLPTEVFQASKNRDTLVYLIDWLVGKGQLSTGKVPILEFVKKLIPHVNDPQALDTWIKDVARHFQLTPQPQIDNVSSEVDNIGGKRPPESPPAVTTPLYLLIALEPKTKKPKTYLFQAWLVKGQDLPKRIVLQQEVVSLKEKDILTLIKNLLGKIKKELQQNKEKLTIEFFLPTDLLNQNIEEWMSGRDYPLGIDYCVVVRPVERVKQDEKLNRLHRYWKNDKLRNAVTECAVWLETTTDCCLLPSLLSKGVIFFGLNFILNKECFKELICSGVPMALWIRQETAKQWQCDWYTQEFSGCRLEELPERLRIKRIDSWGQHKHTGHLSLLWDDPTRVPLELQEDFKLSNLQP